VLICTHSIVFEGESIAKMYIGNWSDYEVIMTEKFGKDLQPQLVGKNFSMRFIH